MLTTIGYEKAELDDFLCTLTDSGVEIVIDIRDRAQSRRKGFSKTALSSALKNVGIQYQHMKALGDPKEGREAARAGDMRKFRRIFEKVLQSDQARESIYQLEFLARDYVICLLCYERDALQCHRKIVADKVKSKVGVPIKHLGVVQSVETQKPSGRMLYSRESVTASV